MASNKREFERMKMWWTIVVLCGVLVALRAAPLGSLARWGVDDANITYAFAENIAHGHGYTFGHEDAVVVEGSTSLAWTMILSGAAALGAPINTSALVLGSLFLMGSALICVAIVRRMGGSSAHAFAVAALFLLTPGVVEWQALSGLESGLWCFVFLLSWYLLAHTSLLALQIMSLGMLLLTRPESMLYAPVMIILACAMRRTTTRGAGRAAVIQGVVVVAGLIVITALRLAVFDAPLPNTFYAKVGSFAYNLTNGLRYTASVFIAMPIPWLLLAGVLIMDRRWLRTLTPIVLLALVTFVQPILTGGDHFNLGRFTQVHWPFLWMVVVAWIIDRSWLPSLRSGAIALVAIAVQIAPTGLIRADRGVFHGSGKYVLNEYRIGEKGRRIGATLSRMFGTAPRPRIGVLAAGGVAWTYAGPVRDLLGLCNPDVRTYPPTTPSGVPNHDAFSMAMLRAATVDMLHVELMRDRVAFRQWLREAADDPASFDNTLMKGALRTPEFRSMFVPAMLSRNGDTVCALVSRTWTRGREQVQVEVVGW